MLGYSNAMVVSAIQAEVAAINYIAVRLETSIMRYSINSRQYQASSCFIDGEHDYEG